MARLLVVEDSLTQAKWIQALLTKAGHEVRVAADGIQGLTATEEFSPQVMLTDLQMPEMDGLELVKVMRHRHPAIPVVLMTAFGSDDIAVEALKRGAASYVPKARLAQDLPRTLQELLTLINSRASDRALPFLQQCEANFLLDNDATTIPAVTGYIQNMLQQVQHSNENTLLRLGIAMHEAFANAIYHGNLQVSSETREGDGKLFDDLVAQRRQEAPYANRRIAVTARVSQTEAVIAVRDEGPGFDPALIPDPTTEANLEKLSGRGLLLIRTFLDEVRHNSRGNEITMLKRCEIAPPPDSVN